MTIVLGNVSGVGTNLFLMFKLILAFIILEHLYKHSVVLICIRALWWSSRHNCNCFVFKEARRANQIFVLAGLE